jgi:hypothetical protein
MLKKSASTKKVEVQAKVEKKRVWSSLNLDLDLSLSQKLRPCWTKFLSILWECLIVVVHVQILNVLACQHGLSLTC